VSDRGIHNSDIRAPDDSRIELSAHKQKGDAMFGRTFGWLIGLIVAVLVLGSVAAVAFQAGQASAPVVPVGTGVAGAVPVYVGHYGWGFGWGFGFLGFLIPLFFIILLIGAFRGRRGWGPGGSYRGGWTDYPGGDPRDPRRRWIQQFHRELHDAEDAGRSPSTPPTSGAGDGNSGSGGPSNPGSTA
jgi:hypothetical protein